MMSPMSSSQRPSFVNFCTSPRVRSQGGCMRATLRARNVSATASAASSSSCCCKRSTNSSHRRTARRHLSSSVVSTTKWPRRSCRTTPLIVASCSFRQFGGNGRRSGLDTKSQCAPMLRRNSRHAASRTERVVTRRRPLRQSWDLDKAEADFTHELFQSILMIPFLPSPPCIFCCVTLQFSWRTIEAKRIPGTCRPTSEGSSGSPAASLFNLASARLMTSLRSTGRRSSAASCVSGSPFGPLRNKSLEYLSKQCDHRVGKFPDLFRPERVCGEPEGNGDCTDAMSGPGGVRCREDNYFGRCLTHTASASSCMTSGSSCMSSARALTSASASSSSSTSVFLTVWTSASTLQLRSRVVESCCSAGVPSSPKRHSRCCSDL
mmetsp:Transcript_11792/g.25179  ORF Transcript_11792/g.25179 Transcript_11792/m.25179 type:complete len:378 (-) Transcript_11792:513-1646(-)